MKDPQLQYQRQAVKNASPAELVTKLYDFAIQACYKEDEERLYQVLAALIKSLNFDYEISGNLYGLYEYCQRMSRERKFEEVRELLEPIREAWIEGVVKNREQANTPNGNGFLV
ncbi:MAG: flagellar export chaperone FliS [Balneolaceae bacterium]|nr:flagellar export chaperone FliS [Balneolaceae bacterium]